MSGYVYVCGACSQHAEANALKGHVTKSSDAIQESGNSETKKSKGIVFWGGAARRDAFFEQIRFVQDRNDSNLLVETTRKAQANESVPERLLKVKQMKQTYESRRVKQASERILRHHGDRQRRQQQQQHRRSSRSRRAASEVWIGLYQSSTAERFHWV